VGIRRERPIKGDFALSKRSPDKSETYESNSSSTVNAKQQMPNKRTQ
jgi:hypothetical protein